MIALIFGFIFSLFQANLSNDILDQVSTYIININDRKEVSESYWALGELVAETCSFDKKIKREIVNSQNFNGKQLFLSYNCDSGLHNKLDLYKSLAILTGESGLATFYLVSEENEEDRNSFFDMYIASWDKSLSDEHRLFLRLIHSKTAIPLKDIPNSLTELFLYPILYNYNDGIYLESYDRLKLALELKDRFKLQANQNTIKSAIGASIASFLLFEQYLNHDLASLHDLIIHQSLFPLTIEKNRYIKGLAYAHYSIGRYDKSLELHRKIISPIASYYGKNDEFFSSKFTQGVNLFALGNFQKAKEIFESFDPNSIPPSYQAQISNNLSICYLNLGEKNRYVTLMLRALNEAETRDANSKDESEKKYQAKLTILSNLFSFYTSIGDKETALSYLTDAKEIAAEKKDTTQIANLNAFTGIFYWKNNNDPFRGSKELLRAKEQFNSTTNFYDYSRAIKNLSQIYLETDSLENARNLLIELKTLALENSNSKAFLESLIGLTEISLKAGNLNETRANLTEISQYQLDVLEFKTLVKYHTIRSKFMFQTSSQRDAYTAFRPVVNMVLDRARTSIDTQTGYWIQEQEYLDAFNTILEIMISMRYKHETIQLLDEIKSINDAALYNSPILRASKLSEEELALDRILNDEIAQLRSKYLNAGTASAKQAIEIEIEKRSAQREDILNEIRTERPHKQLPVWAIQQSLRDQDEIIHFTEVGDYLYTSVITNSVVSTARFDFDTDQKALFSKVADNLANSSIDLTELFQIQKILNLDELIAPEISKVTVIPDNYLYRIPLDILPTSEPKRARSFGSTHYLIEEYQLEYFTSLSEFWTNSRVNSINLPDDFSVFAISDFSAYTNKNLPTLPFATQEARIIERTLDSTFTTNIYIENEATKKQFLSEISHTKVVHIATHSEVSEQDPMFSTIFLNKASSSEANAALYAYELYDTSLNSDLIMLNSCSSGSGEYLQGSGIMGINRALRYAGAKSLALNLWAVNDKVASEFAGAFYEAINDGKSKTEAMRIAKLRLLRTGNANPHYWGAYMLIGNPSPIQQKPASAGFMLLTSLLLISSVVMARRMA